MTEWSRFKWCHLYNWACTRVLIWAWFTSEKTTIRCSGALKTLQFWNCKDIYPTPSEFQPCWEWLRRRYGRRLKWRWNLADGDICAVPLSSYSLSTGICTLIYYGTGCLVSQSLPASSAPRGIRRSGNIRWGFITSILPQTISLKQEENPATNHLMIVSTLIRILTLQKKTTVFIASCPSPNRQVL